MKKYWKTLCAALMISLVPITVAYGAPTNKNLIIDGENQNLPVAPLYMDGTAYRGAGEIPPVIYNSRIYMALGDLKSLLGAKVEWDAKTESAVITKENVSLVMKKDSSTYTVNGKKKSMDHDMAMKIANNRSVAPLSVIARELGFSVDYEGATGRTYLAYRPSSSGQESLFSPEELRTDLPFSKKPAADNSGDSIFSGGEGLASPGTPAPLDKPSFAAPIEQAPLITGVSGPPGVILYSWSYNQDNTESYEISTGSNSSYLVNKGGQSIEILIKNAIMDHNLLTAEQYPASNFLDRMSSRFSDNTTILTLHLKTGIDASSCKITEGTRSVIIKYAPGQKEEINKGYVYASDRIHSTLTLKLLRGFEIKKGDLENAGGSLVFELPKDCIQMITGLDKIADRNLSSIEVSDTGSSYQVKLQLRERVSTTLEQNGGDRILKIAFKKLPNPQIRVAVDPGHGGKDPGAVHRLTGLSEKDITLPIASRVVQKLQSQGVDAYLTKDNDAFMELASRADRGNTADADLFVSIHGNSSNGNSEANGIETWHYPSEDNKKLAKSIQSAMIQQTGATNRGTKTAKFVVLNLTKMPAALVEVGFISNLEESSRLSDPSYQDTLAEAIAQGIINWIQSQP